MQRIIHDPKLDFDDVLMLPSRSTLLSRNPESGGPNLEREFKFYHSNQILKGTGIIAANMDTVGSFDMAKKLSEYNCFTALHKHYKEHELIEFFDNNKHIWDKVFYTIGTSEKDMTKMFRVSIELYKNKCKLENKDFNENEFYLPENLSALENKIRNYFPKLICIDVANGYMEKFIKHVQLTRKLYPNAVIMAGNVVTGDITQELIIAGADVIKVGIGGGCFVAGTKVKTEKGLKKIEDIEVGEKVYTHRNRLQKVKGKLVRQEDKKLININGIKCTDNHEFYVVNKKYRDIITDGNLNEYAEWIEAKDLTKDYFLLKMK